MSPSKIASLVKEIVVNIPTVATKQLKLRTCKGKRRVTLSSNWLVAFGFDGSKNVVETALGEGKGISVRLAGDNDLKTKKVYSRIYKYRSANPLNPVAGRKERLIEISSQELINHALGPNCMFVHLTFLQGEVIFQPVVKEQYELLQRVDRHTKINTLVAMTGGVDCHALENNNFAVDTVLSFRPQDKRDKTDYTEFDCMSVLVNSSPRVLINEDIYEICPKRLSTLIGDTPITVGHFSLTCEEFSNLKNNSAKAKSLDDVDSTIDMFIPMLDILRHVKFPVLVIENVEGFINSASNDILKLQLRRLGYRVSQGVFKANQQGGNSLRKRMYLIASTLDAPITLPPPEIVETANIWDKIILPNWDEIEQLDVTDTKVIKDALETGRARIINAEKGFSPTLARSQSQCPKDAVICERDGRYYRLPVSVQKAINNIPESFDLDWAPLDKASQIIGQSICYSMHERIMQSVRSHILNAAEKLNNELRMCQLAMGF